MKHFATTMAHPLVIRVACLVIAYALAQTLFALPFTPSLVDWAYPSALLVPGIVMMAINRSVTGWYQWLAVAMLGIVTLAPAAPAVVTIGWAWAGWNIAKKWAKHPEKTSDDKAAKA